jgi:tRNA(Ile)-lysidine synthase
LAALDTLAGEHFAENPGLEVAQLSAQPKAVRTRVLRLALLGAGLDGGLLTYEHLERGDQLLVEWHGQGEISLPGGLSLARKSGRLILSPLGVGKP